MFFLILWTIFVLLNVWTITVLSHFIDNLCSFLTEWIIVFNRMSYDIVLSYCFFWLSRQLLVFLIGKRPRYTHLRKLVWLLEGVDPAQSSDYWRWTLKRRPTNGLAEDSTIHTIRPIATHDVDVTEATQTCHKTITRYLNRY